MISTSLITKIIRWILHGIQLQLFITLFSLPLLCAWGLPLSLLSPLGNLLFGPMLTLFLLLSSFIFLTELIGIPNGLLIMLLEQVTTYWLSIMHADTKRWLIGFTQPSYFILLLLPLSAILVMICNQTRSLYRSSICLLLLLIGFWGYAWYLQRSTPAHIPIICNNGAVHLIQHQGTFTLIDPGYLGKTMGAPSWVQFTLIPQIIQRTGCTVLDHVIVLQPNTMTLKAVESLMIKMPIKNVYIPYWHGSLSSSGLHTYSAIKKMCRDKNILLTRISSSIQHITLDPTCTITIEPLPQIIQTTSISYPAFTVHTFIDNQDVTLYSAKYVEKHRDQH
ncbi:MAG: hypothetical protein ACHQVS_00310 [Candidatus Babeliales bacterium]